MSTDAHPEDLLDAWRDGTLDESGRAKLDTHARGCVACRLELGIEAGLDDELGARPEDRTRMAAMIGAAMVELPQTPAPASGGGSGGGSGGISKLALAGVAAAGGVVLAIVIARGDGATDGVQPIDGDAAPAVVDRVDPPRPPPPTAPEPGPVVPAEPEVPSVEPAEASEAAEAPKVASPKAAPAASADELLRDANAKRRARDYPAAAAVYGRLAKRHRGSDEEVLSRVTYGRMLLEHLDRPADALGRFDAYLASRPSGTLAEEALVGRAKALGRLGRKKAEREAWTQVLERFPDSAYASMARERLGE